MSTLVEVKILDYVLVLPCEECATVAEITSAAVAEVQSFNIRNFPRKVLHTKDSAGRILGSSLRPIQSQLEPRIEVVVATYNSSDALSPQETLSLFRDWQLWTANQVLQAVRAISIEDVPALPDTNTTLLLYELCKAPVESVQMVCLKALQSLLTKFPQQALVIQAAEHISKVFATTNFATVAVAALECFKGLSPLQARVFNGAKYVRDMYNVQHALARFPQDKQSMLFEAFRAISAIVGDRELARVLQPDPAAPALLPGSDDPTGGSFIESAMSQTTGAGTEGTEEILKQIVPPLPAPSLLPVAPNTAKRINLKRLESLLSSEDRGVRQYALQKLLKLLTLSSRAHLVDMDKTGIGKMGKEAAGVDAVETGAVVQRTPPSAANMWDSRSSRPEDSGDWEDPQSRPDSAYKFSFSDGKEVESLVKCLFRCLKACIHARPSRAPRATAAAQLTEPAAVTGATGDKASPETSFPPEAVKTRSAIDRSRGGAVTAESTAGRLIQTALLSPQTDEGAVLLVVDCLWQIVFFAQDVVQDARFPLGMRRGPARQKLKLTGSELSNLQLVFASAAREWYRLLLTLSHADEGSKLLRYADLAEKSAFFFAVVVLHGMEDGWRESELSLEAPAVCAFLNAPQPTFRSYLALTYLTYVSANSFPSGDRGDDVVEGKGRRALPGPKEVDGAGRQALQDLLMWRSFEASNSLWRWATGPERARRSALMALTCLSSCCALSSFVAFMTSLDPLVKLASMLQVAVRDEDSERREYGIVTAQSVGASEVPAVLVRESGSEDDWDAPRHLTRIPVVASAEEAEADAAEAGPPELTVDGLFGARFGLGAVDEVGVAVAGTAALSAQTAAVERRNPVDWLTSRSKAILSAAKAAVEHDPSAYVYPDIPLIRLILKTIANLLNAARSSGTYSREYRSELGNWLREAEIGPPGENTGKVRLLRVVRRDETVAFYFNMIASQSS